MVKKKQRARTKPPESRPSAKAQEPKRKKWTLLYYICGDNDILDTFVEEALTQLCSVGSSPDLHIVVQLDRRAGARRYVLPEGPSSNPQFDKNFDNIRVNTGEPAEARDFLRWGLRQAPSRHVAVIFSGLGINPAYVADLLIPQETRITESETSSDRVQERLFSICHDQTSADALEAHELSEILEPIANELNRNIDLLGLDMGAAAFVEICYQLQGPVDVFVASQRPLPDAGWPHAEILRSFHKKLAGGEVDGQELGKLIVDAVASQYPDKKDDVRMAAVDLNCLDSISRALDTVSLAIMQNLGDWHILQAVHVAGERTEWISPKLASDETSAKFDPATDASFLPAVDLLELLTETLKALREEEPKTPPAFGQHERIVLLAQLVDNALKLMKPKELGEPRLLLHSQPKPDRGLSILLPPPSAGTSDCKDVIYSLANSNYLKLRFSSRVHWSAMTGAFQLITEQPHVLWRLISSVLTNASGPARDALLQQLVSGDSVIGELQEQFKSVSSDAALTLSLEPKQSFDEFEAGREYVLRLESPVSAATVAEQVSRLYQATIDAALDGLERLLQDPRGASNISGQLESLGRTLGEDLIQDLSSRLEEEQQSLRKSTSGTPHLRLQIPGDLMRYSWELMHDRYGMLCERFAVGRQIFTATDIARRRAARKPGAIRALVIGDPKLDVAFAEQFAKINKGLPAKLPGAQQEAQDVVVAFEQFAKDLAGMPAVEVTNVIGDRLSRFEMREHLRSGRFDIIHFAGHAQYIETDPEGSAWLLSDGLLRARDIRNTLAWTESPPWLVFANACEAGMDGTKECSAYQGDVYGLATACINQGVAAYIAPLWPVDDRIATQLAVSFYRSLLIERFSLGESLFRARAYVRAKQREQDGESPDVVGIPRTMLSWASFVLYGDPTRQLLESLWSPSAGKATATSTGTKS